MAGQKRIEQLNSEIEKYLSEILRELKDPRINGIISVQQAEITRDFSHCTVYVSIFNSTNNDECFSALINSTPFIRKELAKHLDIRIVPELHFKLDTTLDYAEKIGKLIDKAVENK